MSKARKCQKLLDKYTKLAEECSEFIEETIRLPMKFDKPIKMWRYFVATGIELMKWSGEIAVVGNVMVDVTEYVPLSHLTLTDMNHLMYHLRDSGYFKEKK